MFRIAVVGSGFMAKTWCLVAEQTTGAEMVAVFGGRNSREFAEQFSLRNFDTFDALLAENGIDAVIITSPPGAHCTQTLAALDSGKHVLVEKPMATTMDEAVQMVDRARATGRTLGVVSQNRYRHSPALAKQLIIDDQYSLGSLKTVLVKGQVERWWRGSTTGSWKATVDSFDPWTGWASHACDLVNWFASSEPTDVFAVGSSDSGLWETIVAGVSYSNGTLATLMLDHVEKVPKNSPTMFFELRFEDGEIRFDTHGSLALGKRGVWTTHGIELDSQQGQLSYTDDSVVRNPIRLNTYGSQLRNFLDSANSGRDPDVGIRAGLSTQSVMNGIMTSVSTSSMVSLQPL
jgi:UDP-N-acetyl-2-amino-2-deoxyglucuronate dehydrogenase